MEVYRAEQTAASSVLIAVCGRYISEKNTREDKTFMQKKKKKIWSRFRKIDITSTLLAFRGFRISILARDHLIKVGRVRNFWASRCFHGERSGIQ